MIRKILLSLLLLIVLAVGGLFTLLATNSDIIIDKFHSYVENSTGAPLISQSRPVFTLLPNRGLELGASSWQKPDGSLSISFSRASVLISSHSLFVGRFSIKNLTVEDLDLTMRLEKPLCEYAGIAAAKLGKRRDIDDIVHIGLQALNIAPDTINIQRGRICLIEPSGNRIQLAPVTFKASDVHPGSRTELSLKTEISGTLPPFRADAELNCTALFTKRDANFTAEKASLTPIEGFPFMEELSFSGAMGYSYESSSFTFSSLAFSGPELSVKASGGIESLSDFYRDPREGRVSATLELTSGPKELGRLLGFSQPFSSFELKSDVNWQAGSLTLDAMQCKADDLTFTGSLRSSFLPFSLTGELRFAELNLDAFKGRTAARKGAEIAPNDFSRWPKVSLNIGADSLRWDRLLLENVEMRVTGQNGTYELNPLTAALAGSPVTASLKAVMLPTSPLSARIGLNFSVPQAELEDICELLLKRKLLQGKSSINAALSFTTSRGLPSLSGTGSITSSKVKTDFDVLPSRAAVVSLINPGNSFDKLVIAFQAKDGRINIQDFTLAAPRFSLSGRGMLDLPKKNIDAAGSMRIGGSTVLPVRLQGSVNKPKYSLDTRSNADNPASLDITLDGGDLKDLDKIFSAPR
ncbi:MAG: hypothetical protein IIV56_03705 [Mailhella sp.]|nr:hypothetical protein [Mailhella sp.]